jgi:hypothetical protein
VQDQHANREILALLIDMQKLKYFGDAYNMFMAVA